MRWLDGITGSMNMNQFAHILGKLQEMVRNRDACHAAVHGAVESHMMGRLNNKTLKLPDGDDKDQSRQIGNRE